MRSRTSFGLSALFRLLFLRIWRHPFRVIRLALLVFVSCFLLKETGAHQIAIEACVCEVHSIKRLDEHSFLLTGIMEEGTCFMLVNHGRRVGYWDSFDFAGYSLNEGLTLLNRNGLWEQIALTEVADGGFGIATEPSVNGEIDVRRLYLPTVVGRDRQIEIRFAKYLPSSDEWILAVDSLVNERWFRFSIKTGEKQELEMKTEELEYLDFFDFDFRGENQYIHFLGTEPRKMLLCRESGISKYKCMRFSVRPTTFSDPEFRDIGELDQIVFNKELTGGFLVREEANNTAPIFSWSFDGQEEKKIGEINVSNLVDISKFRENRRLAVQNDWLVWIDSGEGGILRTRKLSTGEEIAFSFPGVRICSVGPVADSGQEIFFVDSTGDVSVVNCTNGQIVSTFSGISHE